MTTTRSILLALLAAFALAAPRSASARAGSLRFSPDGKRVSAVNFGKGYVWDAGSGKLLLTLEGAVKQLQFTVDGKSLVGLDPRSGTIQFWDLTGTPLRTFKVPDAVAIGVTPDGRSLLVVQVLLDEHKGLGTPLAVVDLATGKIKKTLRSPEPAGNGLPCVSFAPDGKRVADCRGNIFNLETDALVHRDSLCGLAATWTNDGTQVFVAGEWRGRFVDAARPLPEGDITPIQGPASPTAFSAIFTTDGKWLGLATLKGFEWWKLQDDGKFQFNVSWNGDGAYTQAVAALASPDRKLYAVAADSDGQSDTIVHLLDADSSNGTIVKTLKATQREVAGGQADSQPRAAEAKPSTEKVAVAAAAPVVDASLKQYVDKVSVGASHACAQMGKLESPLEYKSELRYDSQIKTMISLADDCGPSVAAARKAGVPAGAMIEFSKYQSSVTSPMTLDDVDTKVCQAFTQLAAAALKVRTVELEKRREPYLKVLSGDKARIFQQRDMINGLGYYFGRNKKQLKTPEDFRTADVWYENVRIHKNAYPEWLVEGFKFNGMTQTGTYYHTGLGTEAPPSEFNK